MRPLLAVALAAAAVWACLPVSSVSVAGASLPCTLDSGIVSLSFDGESGALTSLRDSAPGGTELIATPVAEPFWVLQVRFRVLS